jgi:DMSO reductase family type II enzyme heme b subunit
MKRDQLTEAGTRKSLIGWVTTAAICVLLVTNGCRRSSPADKPAQGPASPARTEQTGTPDAQAPDPTALPDPAELGKQLFASHCAACHGERGDGKGIAAVFLFPKPRDFRAGRFRVVSTDNNVPTREDLQAVLLRGMPGSSMPPWAHLSQEERDALVDEVMRIRREGADEFYVKSLKEDEELTDEEIAADDVQQEIRDYVDEFTTPGKSSVVPEIGPPTESSVARGKELYTKFACIQCHGETGKGDGAAPMVDGEGLPTRPRDFTLGIFKGNPDPASIYRRIAYGMPGTPMPSAGNITPEQLVDLAHYVRAMSTEDQRRTTVLNREKIVVQTVDTLPDTEDAAAWSEVKPVHLRMAPLWWRQDADPDFTVQAVHDGKTMAVRLTWRDDTNDEHALRGESFEDAVAMELFRGPAEPFLGMGDAASPVDVWFWDADRQAGSVAAEQSYPNAVVDVYPFSETVVAGAELTRPGARMADQPDVSMPARAAGNQIVPTGDEAGGSSLHVGGPGSVTFRIPQSQLVQAHGTRSNDRWSVVMRRELSVPSANDGVSLEPGGRASVAFAVWDGAHHDRDGQKSITIWQDLDLQE